MSLIGGQTEDVVQRWVLDPTEYKKGIKDVATLIREQVKHEKDLNTVHAELDKTTSKLSQTMASVSELMGKAGISTSLLAGGVGGLVAMIGGKLIGALGEAAAKLGAFINAGDDFNDTVEENRASVWRMTEATQHMGSAMDVAKFRAKLMASEGLQPTEAQLESLTRAATNLATKQKTDWASAADTLSNAWQGMGARALKPLNIEIEQNGTLLEKQRQILEGVLQLGPAVLTQAEKEKALIKEKDNAYLHLSSTMNDVGAVSALMNFSQVTRLQNEIAHVKSLELGYLRVRNAILGSGLAGKIASASGLGAGMDALRAVAAQEQIDATAQAARGMIPAGLQGAEVMGFFQTGKAKQTFDKGVGGKKQHPWWDHYLEEQAKELEEEAAYVMAEEERKLKKSYAEKRKGREWGMESSEFEQRAQAEREFKRFGRETAVDKLSGTFAGSMMGNKVAEQATKSAEALEKYRKVVQGINADMNDFTVGSLQNFTGGLWAAADAAIQGGDSFGMAMAKMLKATLLSIAQQSTVKAIFNLAEAAAQWFNPYAVSMHLTAAALYGSIAVATGAAGLGMSAAMAGGASASAGASHNNIGGNSYRPSYGSREAADKKPIVVNVWLGGKGDPAAALYIRQQIKAAVA